MAIYNVSNKVAFEQKRTINEPKYKTFYSSKSEWHVSNEILISYDSRVMLLFNDKKIDFGKWKFLSKIRQYDIEQFGIYSNDC